jgi:hypothetical protein
MILLTLILLLFGIIYWISKQDDTVPDKLDGIYKKGTGMSNTIGYPTHNIIMKHRFPCGVYRADSIIGPATVFVHNQIAEIHFDEFHPKIHKSVLVSLRNLKKIDSHTGIVGYYQMGCKN